MKRTIKITSLCLFALLSLTVVTNQGCRSKKKGCGMEEKLAPPTDRRGNLSTKSGKSSLFSKKMRKRSGR